MAKIKSSKFEMSNFELPKPSKVQKIAVNVENGIYMEGEKKKGGKWLQSNVMSCTNWLDWWCGLIKTYQTPLQSTSISAFFTILHSIFSSCSSLLLCRQVYTYILGYFSFHRYFLIYTKNIIIIKKVNLFNFGN